MAGNYQFARDNRVRQQTFSVRRRLSRLCAEMPGRVFSSPPVPEDCLKTPLHLGCQETGVELFHVVGVVQRRYKRQTMKQFSYGPIDQIPTSSPTVYAFQVSGHMSYEASEAMAEYMNQVFDQNDKISMLLDLTGFTGSDWDTMLDGDVIQSRFRALSHVDRYAVIGAPENAAKMISFMDKIIPVDARAFDASEAQAAWKFVGARPEVG